MADIEKVIKALELCYSGCFAKSADKCTYSYTEDHVCIMNLIIDAAALLKALRPRVLTLEEIPTFDGAMLMELCWKPLYHEQLFWVSYQGERIPYILLRGFDTATTSWLKDAYNLNWRCWSSRPTDAQREAEAWME